MMISDDTQNIMRLLTQVIWADGHILQSEIHALVSSAQELCLTNVNEELLSPDDIRAWFEEYLKDLSETASLERNDVAITHLILSLEHWPNKQGVIQVLEKISKADAEYHLEEKLLISTIKAYWYFDDVGVPISAA